MAFLATIATLTTSSSMTAEDEWVAPDYAPKWVLNDKTWVEEPEPGENPTGGVTFHVDPNGTDPGPGGLIGYIFQEVTVSMILCDCDILGNPINCTLETLTYYELFNVDTIEVQPGSMVDVFGLKGQTGGGAGWIKIRGRGKFVKADTFDHMNGETPLDEFTNSDPKPPGNIHGQPWGTGSAPSIPDKPSDWDSDFDGQSVNMPEHSFTMSWNNCLELDCGTDFTASDGDD